MSRTDLTECPKCSGTGEVPHKHIEDGVCFLCAGARQVTEATASRWLAAQGRIAHVRGPVAVPTDRVSMEIDLGAVFGRCTVTHNYDMAPGEFSVRLGAVRDGSTDERGQTDGGYRVWFTTSGGRVTVDRSSLENGMRYHGHNRAGQLQSALQAAI